MKILENVDSYRVKEPLFEGVRIILNYLGEPYTPAYIQGISGAAFRVATGCPSCPTCCTMTWTTNLIGLLGYEYEEYPCYGPNNEKLTGEMISAVRASIDDGKPALVWHAVTNAEWDVVAGYDEVKGVFFGRGSYWGPEKAEYRQRAWTRAEEAINICPAFGVVIFGAKTGCFDAKTAEINALKDAAAHARSTQENEGINALRNWAAKFAGPGATQNPADNAYCFDIYHSTHAAAPAFLREIAGCYPEAAAGQFLRAAEYMEREAETFAACKPYLGWEAPGELDEEKSAEAARLLSETAELYEKAIECVEQGLRHL